jgi:hypothetical protein
VLQRIFPRKRALMLFISGLLVLLLIPAVVFIHPGTAARASGGGGGGTPVVNIFPTTASPGTQINVQGFSYPTNVTVKIFFQTTSNGVVTVITDQSGFFFTPLTIPSTYVPGTKYFVHVNSSTFSVKVLFTFTKPSISVRGEFGQEPAFGSPAQVNGSGFAANETVDLTWDFGALGQKKAGVAASDNSGFFFTTLKMPSIPFGIQAHLIATGLISGVSARTLVNEIPAVIPSPTAGTIGTTVSLTGGGFGSNEGVKILFQGKLVASPGTNVNGAFKASFIVPDTAKIGFQYNDIVASGKTSGVGASATFVVKPNLSISPNQGSSGTLIKVRGSHFTPNGFATILWIFPGTGGSGGSGGGQLFLTNVQVSANGTFNVTITAPGGLVAGQTNFVQAIDDTSGGSNQVKFFAV